VAWLTFNRPDAGNSVTPDQRNRLIDHLDAASADPTVRCVVLTANGRHFCTGADLRADRSDGPAKPEGAPDRMVGDAMRMIATGAQRLISDILNCENQVIVSQRDRGRPGRSPDAGGRPRDRRRGVKIIEVFVRRGSSPMPAVPTADPGRGPHKAEGAGLLRRRPAGRGRRRLGIVTRSCPPTARGHPTEWSVARQARPGRSPTSG
jgi:2-(1,2-epoxy-1,2-dihydrophenyl)acetyl-CoA isomerase